MPITVISVSRQGHAHPAVALGLDHARWCRSRAMPKLVPEIATLVAQELAPQVLPGGHRQPARLVGEIGRGVGHLGQEDVAHLGPVAVDGRHQDVRGLVVAQLHDQLGQVGLHRGDAVVLQVLVEPDLLGGHRLDLDHLVHALRADQIGDDPVGLLRVGWPSARRRRGR